MAQYKLIISCLLLIGMVSCQKGKEYFPHDLHPVDVPIHRYDRALLNIDTTNIRQEVRNLYNNYEDFTYIYVENILGCSVNDTNAVCSLLPPFLTDTLYGFRATNQLTKEKFEDLSTLQNQLTIAFSRINYLFPTWSIPEIYTLISGFNTTVFYYNNIIGIGLDMYLGSDYPYYNQVVYNYQKTTMRPECIAPDVMLTYLNYNMQYNSKYNRLLEQMIFRGKQMFLLNQLLPDVPDSTLMGYTLDQWKWCNHYEKNIWNTIMSKKDLFKTESRVLSSYLNDGPFTAEISQDSPGRVGVYIGWMIVKSYMQYHPELTLPELMNEGDAQKILEQSLYRP